MGDRDDYILFSGGAPGAERPIRRERRAARHRGSQLRLRGPRARPHARPAHPEPRGAEGRRRQPRLRLEADEPPLHGRPDHPQGAAEIWYQVNHGQEIFVIGAILPTINTVKGGTGWGAEFAKLCNKPLFVFDQDRDRVVHLEGQQAWVPCARRRAGHPPRRTSPAPARATSQTAASARSPRCSSARFGRSRVASTGHPPSARRWPRSESPISHRH